MKFLKAVKSGFVKGREAYEGEKVETFASNGLETTNTASSGDIIVTACDAYGNPVLRNGKENTWIVKPDVFSKKYELAKKGIYHPRGGEQSFVVLDHDTCFVAPWGEQQIISKGGVINVTSFNDMYGIGEDAFKRTYTILEEKEF